VIIAVNKCESVASEEEWKSATATASALKTNIRSNPTFQRLEEKWRNSTKGPRVFNTEKLLECYYSSVHVVKLPKKQSMQRMLLQRDELYRVITDCCANSKESKQDLNMLPDVDEFGLYMTFAFDHFSQSLDESFDYMEASLRYLPPPLTLAENFKKFASLVRDHMGSEARSTSDVFDELKPMIASCLMLDSARKQRMGHSPNLSIYATKANS